MKAKNQQTVKVVDQNHPMRQIKIEKILLSAGAVDKELQKSKKLLEIVSAMKAQLVSSSKRIPDFGVSPGMEVGTRVTIRGKKGVELLRRLLGAIDNILKKKQVSQNHFSFGIHEYIDIPGMEYQRDIGIKGFNVTVVFVRPGFRTKRKKIKSGNIPKRQFVSQEEIIKYMGENFNTKFK